MFLDPTKPIVTCSESSCAGCKVARSLHCHFAGRDLAKFFGAFLLVLGLGVVGISRVSPWWLIPWGVLAVAYFGFIEIRVMCSHCPHYAEPGNSLKCWANYGSPKLWAYRPGPMSSAETGIFTAGLIAVLGYPMAFVLHQWVIGILYIAALVGAYVYMRTAMCSQCMNFACPLNLVDPSIRDAFFSLNPGVFQAWGRGGRT
jgi:hypothetical protein